MLGDFVEKTFVEELENGAVKAALLQWLKLLTLIDHVRSFGLLNAVAVRNRTPPPHDPLMTQGIDLR